MHYMGFQGIPDESAETLADRLQALAWIVGALEKRVEALETPRTSTVLYAPEKPETVREE